MKNKAKICLALDVSDLKQITFLISELKDSVHMFKVGLQLYCKYGNKIVEKLKKAGLEVFLDLKFLDIPNTVASACREVTRLGADIINVHTLGGVDMMKAAANAVYEESERLGVKKPNVIGVTILTSIDESTMNRELKINGSVEKQVISLAKLAKKTGLEGVVASPLETKEIRKACGDNFLIITPGIRPASSELGDQKRVLTPRQAMLSGSNVIVIGRPIYEAKNPFEIAQTIRNEIDA